MKNPTILLGLTKHSGKIKGATLEWIDNNGILIAGQSGSGKSQTAAFLLNQYAALGVKLIICDYDSPDGNEETLSGRIAHLADSFYLAPVKTAEDIQAQLVKLDKEYRLRLTNPDRNFPLLLVIDEVSAFLSYLSDTKKKGEDPIKVFARNLLQFRKVNIRSMIIGQEWSSGFATTTMRPIRSAFKIKLVHRLDRANVSLVMDKADSNTIRTIGHLQTGQMFYNDYVLSVPLLNEKMRTWAIAKLQNYPAQQFIEPTRAQISTNLHNNEVYLKDLLHGDI